MKKFLVLLGCLTWLGTTPAYSSVVDAPHNETSNVKCGDCHTYSLWWQYSPIDSAVVGRDTVTNGVCAKCHSGNGTAPHKLGHSWTSMGEMHKTKNGSWQTNCVDCHNPHLQEQLNYIATDSADLLLVTGILGAANSFSSTPGYTTVGYNAPVVAQTGWTDPTTWSAKNRTLPARGLLLVVDTVNAKATYPIVAADATTITVKGSIATSEAGQSFGLIYGQLIKSQVETPNSGPRAVKFFNPKNAAGGFIDANTPVQGICQVCHTITSYWRNDGTLVNHNNGVACTNCHETASGFKPVYADHYYKIGSVATCVTCHKGGNLVLDVHKGQCNHCHTVPPALVERLLTVTDRPAVCSDCHTGIAADFTTHPQAQDHSGQVVANPEKCTGCHFHNQTDIVGSIHKGQCTSCHNLNNGGVLQGLAVAGPGDCTNCHKDKATNFFSHPNAYNHTNQVEAKVECARCHNGDSIWDVHSSNCGLCHKLPVGLLKGSALAGPGDCLTCHGNFFVHQTLAISHSVQVTATAACVVCHTNPNLVTGIHATNGCQTCHDALGAVIGSATNSPLGGECAACHIDKVVGHPLIDHMNSALNYIVPVTRCVSCHQGLDPVMDIHKGNCLLCHTEITQAAIHTLKPGLSAGDCTHCHAAVRQSVAPDIGASFSYHPKAMDHSGQVEVTVGCNQCHSGNPVWNIHPCGDCHDQDPDRLGTDGILKGSALAGPGDCVHCHDLFAAGSKHMTTLVENKHLNTYVKINPTCTTLYAVPTRDAEGNPILDPQGNPVLTSCHNNLNPLTGIHATNGCSTCHSTTGVLVPAAVAGEGDCLKCHANYYALPANVDDRECLACHTAHNRW